MWQEYEQTLTGKQSSNPFLDIHPNESNILITNDQQRRARE